MVECLAAAFAPSQGSSFSDPVNFSGLSAEKEVARHHPSEDVMGKHPNCDPQLRGLAEQGGAGPKGESVRRPLPQPQHDLLFQGSRVQCDRQEEDAGGAAARAFAAGVGRGPAPSV